MKGEVSMATFQKSAMPTPKASNSAQITKQGLANLPAFNLAGRSGSVSQGGNVKSDDYYRKMAESIVTNRLSPEDKRLNSRIKNAEKDILAGGGKLPSSEPETPLWMKALDFIARPQRAITGMLAEGSKAGDQSMGQILGAGWKGLTGEEKRDSDEFLENLGWQDKKGKFDLHDVASFALDVGLDPLTYLTLGAGSAAKAAGKAGQKAFKESMAKAPVTNWAEAAKKAAQEEAMRQGNKNLIGLRAPFTSSTLTLLSKSGNLGKNGVKVPGLATPISKAFERTADAVSSKQAANLHSKFEELGLKGYDKKVVSQMLGKEIDSFTKLNQEELKFVENYVDKFRAGQVYTPPPAQQAAKGWKVTNRINPKDIYNQILDDVMTKGQNAKVPTRNKAQIVSWLDKNLPDAIKIDKDTLKAMPLEQLRPIFSQHFKIKNLDDVAKQHGFESLDEMFARGQKKNPLQDFVHTRKNIKGGTVAGAHKIKFPQFSQLADQPQPFTKDKDFLSKVDSTFKASGEGRSALNRKISNSKVGSKLDSTVGRMFNGARHVPNQLSEANPGLEDSVKIIHDSNVKSHSQQKQVFDEIAGMIKANKLTKEERESIGYYLEGTRDIAEASEKVKKVVEHARTRLSEIAGRERDAGILKGTRDNYVPHIFNDALNDLDPSMIPDKIREASAMGQTHGFTRIREGFDNIAQFDEWKAAHPDSPLDIQRDIAKQLGIREAASIKAINNKEMISQLRKIENGAYIKDKPHKDFVEVKIAGSDPVYVHKELAKHFQYVNNLFTNDKELHTLVRGINNIQHIWKQYVTAAIPGHHTKNLIGNMLNSRMAGVNLSSYAKATRVLKGDLKGNKEMQGVVKEAIERGIIKGGFFGNDFDTGIDQAIDYAMHNDGVLSKVPNTMRRTIGEPIEDISRLGHFLDIYEKTGSFDKATESVHKFLFNYFELSKTEKSVRAFIPFYTWMRNNIPLQLEQLLKNPRYAGAYQDLEEQANDGEIMREYMQGDYVETPFLGDNNFMNMFLPQQDLKAMNPKDLMGDIITGQSPLLKIPNELWNNESMLTGAPIDKYDDGKIEWGDWQSGYLGYGIDQMGLISKLNDIWHPKTDEVSMRNELMGLGFSKPVHVDPKVEKTNRKYAYSRRLDATKKKMKEQGILK